MPKTGKRPVVLVVLDGWGYRPEREGNAIALANTPTWDTLWSCRPRTLLEASGLAVGLPKGQMGNSEVGHLNLGAGRVVPQDLVRIDTAIADGSFFQNEVFVPLCRAVKARGATLHLAGLIGTGGVHAVDRHLFALIDMATREGVPRVAIHALLDGRDTLPRSALGFMETLVQRAAGRATVASLGGRYYGMDRDKRWDRTKLWYDAMVHGAGPTATDPVEAIRAAYDRGESDEFIKPIVIVRDGAPVAPVHDGDGVIFFNFRADRMRQIVRALTQPDFDGFDVRPRPRVDVATMTMYDQTFIVPVAFPPLVLSRIVAEVLADHGRTQFRTAETEKYAHVTYFFNGGFEVPYKGEVRELVPSQKVATYDLAPEMSAPGVTEVLCRAIASREHDFILCNYANGDMVGHTGVIPATIKAVETVDRCLARVLATAAEAEARVIVTADHGNCEMMIDPETGGPHTAHTTNPVPLVIVDPDGDRPLRGGGALRDVGPTLLAMLGVERPAEMTGIDLRDLGARS
ncbi:MAG TPA: 2,3-bisphosphoglycerate-independent phosphoglycerate mutase [Gemmatimonadaceae bacterium]|nr:2,3-bisphosphoglycerate-independent phosphoglycerate mutase [Gemmatimonadaceae bacterium]